MMIRDQPDTRSPFDGSFHYVGSDDMYFRQHFADLARNGQLDTVLPDRRQRQAIALYLGILTVQGNEVKTARPFNVKEVVNNLQRRYRLSHEVAAEAVVGAYMNFVSSLPEIPYPPAESQQTGENNPA